MKRIKKRRFKKYLAFQHYAVELMKDIPET